VKKPDPSSGPIRLQEARDRISHLAFHDSLTELPNRNLLKDRLSIALSRTVRIKRCVAVLFLDLDRFKQVNDRLGHTGGDLLLRELSSRLRKLMRRGDTLARLGGDEFVIVLSDLRRPEDVARIASKVVAAVRTPFFLEGHEVRVTTSIGVSFAPEDGLDGDVLIQNADAAMYRAKENGKDRVEFFTAELHARAMERRALELGLQSAIERGELTVAFQPVFDVGSGALTEVEAFARWPSDGPREVGPREFIPVAEELGLIGELGRRVLRAACLHAMQWRRSGAPGLGLSVNVSAAEIQRPGYADGVRRLLREIGFPAEGLCLDVTEPGGGRLEACFPVLYILKDAGVRLAIDDFGTGGSSLAIVRSFPFDLVKIDCSLIERIPVEERDAAIVKSIIRLGHVLGARVVAKGVERAEQLEFLRYHRCDTAQGFLLGAPVEANRFSLKYLQ
jgi:diguanylate cyclase (GGDEF)-like protein